MIKNSGRLASLQKAVLQAVLVVSFGSCFISLAARQAPAPADSSPANLNVSDLSHHVD